MRAIAFGLKKATAFQHKHAEHDQDESNAPPVEFFHSGKIFYFYNGECTNNLVRTGKFNAVNIPNGKWFAKYQDINP
jgi:site-specific DNA-adenine methylase